MVSQVITAGFKRAGIYLFNPEVIDYGVCDDSANILSSDTSTIYSNSGNKNSPPPDTSSSQHNHTRTRAAISREDLKRNTYNLTDPVYQEWLKIIIQQLQNRYKRNRYKMNQLLTLHRNWLNFTGIKATVSEHF